MKACWMPTRLKPPFSTQQFIRVLPIAGLMGLGSGFCWFNAGDGIAAPAITVAQAVSTPNSQSSGTANGLPFTVRLLELRRTRTAVMARFTFTNTAPNPANLLFLQTALSQIQTPNHPKNPDYNTISSIYVVDAATQEKYEVMRDRNNRPLCSRIDSAISAGQPVEMYAQFAVPTTATHLNVHFPNAGVFIDVPILPPRTAS